MIPDYIIYDELRRRRQQEDAQNQPAVLELPLYNPEITRYYDETRRDDDDTSYNDDEERDRGVVIIDIDRWVERDDEADEDP